MNYAATLFAASLVLIPAVVPAQIDTAASPITLSDAILMAQRNAPSAVQARGSIRTANATVKQSYAAFLPSINLSAGSQRQQGDRFDTQGNLVPFTGNPTNYSTGLNTSLQLFDAGRRFFDVKRTKADVNAAEAGTTIAITGTP